MPATDQPSGLMDIASSLTQDEIPFKLRCAICNKLALNAFRLPCCDQAICETCQTSLPDTCPVCAHTPLSSDLCKPNKALRTTLKAFLRTEEKKREKDRQSTTPAIGAASVDATPAPSEQPIAATPDVAPAIIASKDQATAEEKPEVAPAEETPPEEHLAADSRLAETGEETVPDENPELAAESQVQNEQEDATADPAENLDSADQNGPVEGEEAGDGTPAQPSNAQPGGLQPMPPNAMGFNIPPGGFPNMEWNGSGDFNPMTQFMPNGMFNPQNPIAMSGMAMDPMAASQGMFGGYGMNMNGMNNGMNMGMNFDAGQGMYGGWDGSQNNMWNGGQDKFNPNAFANGMGSQYGPSSGFGGYNMSHQPNGNYAQMQHQPFPNQDFSNGYYGPGYGRGNFRGRGRGFTPGGRGRGGFPGHMHANYYNANNQSFQNPNSPSFTQAVPSQVQGENSAANPNSVEAKQLEDGQGPEDSAEHPTPRDPTNEENGEKLVGDMPIDASAAEGVEADDSQLRGIPTIDSLDQADTTHGMSPGFVGMSGPQMGPGFGRGGYMRGGPFPGGRGGGFPGAPFIPGHNMPGKPQGQGVEGAPAAPRAMRQGLPNTSVLRQQTFQSRGRASVPASRPSEISQSATPVEPREEGRPRSRSRSRSRARSPSRSKSRSRSPSRHQPDSRRHQRYRSPSAHGSAEDYERRRERQKQRPRREGKYEERPAVDEERRTRSPSIESSRRSSRRHDKERDRRGARRSRRSHRHHSQSPSRNGDTRDADHLTAIPEENGSSTRDKASGEVLEASGRSHRSRKDRSRREEERERDRDTKRRDRDRDRDRGRDRRDRERDRDRDRDRYREKDRERDRDRERPRDRGDMDKKRSRRDRTTSPADSDYSTRHHSRRIKRSREDEIRNGEKISSSPKPANDQPEKDPHTLEREARNRERLLKEQQRREAAMHPENNNSTSQPSSSHHHHHGHNRDRDRDRDSHHKSSRRRDSRQDRPSALAGGRRLSYKYEDEENDAARAARVEKEREADRWA